MAKTKTVYVCQNCGAKESKWVGKCSTCGEWNSFVEEVEVSTKGNRVASIVGASSSRPLKLSEVKANADERMDTGDGELNRVLGGGIVPGSMILLGGEPGIGKSTLGFNAVLSRMADNLLAGVFSIVGGVISSLAVAWVKRRWERRG